MQFLLSALVIFCAVTGGFVAGQIFSPTTEVDVVQELKTDGRSPSSLNYAINEVLTKAEDDGPKSPVEQAIDRLELSAEEEDLSKALSNDPLSIKLRRALIAPRHGSEIVGHEELGLQYLKEFREHPTQSLASMIKALDAMPVAAYPNERAAVLLAASTLPGQENEVRQLALRELTSTVVEAIDPRRSDSEQVMRISNQMIVPIASHLAYLNTNPNAAAALSGTIDGIMAQPDTGIRYRLAGQFIEKFPQLESELRNTLTSKGIELPVINNTAEAVDEN